MDLTPRLQELLTEALTGTAVPDRADGPPGPAPQPDGRPKGGRPEKFWAEAQAELLQNPARLAVLLPQLPRRLGRQPLRPGAAGDAIAGGDIKVDLGPWRACDGGAAILLAGADPATLDDLYQHGDMEERTMVLRAQGILPLSGATRPLLDEAQRTNTLPHVEAALCDHNLLARARAADAIDADEANRILLKLAFLDLPFERVIDGAQLANEDLSRMVQDLATEREAAGRRVWRDTCRLIALAPTAGSVARLAGALEHGDDGHRLAAADGLTAMPHPVLTPLAKERLPREPHPKVRAALERAIAAGR